MVSGSHSSSPPTPMVMSRLRVFMIALGASGVLACTGQPEGRETGSWRAVVDTIADTIRVHTLSGSIWEDTLSLVPELTIGVMNGPDEYIIGDPRSIALGLAGEIYLLDIQVPVLRAYGPDGGHLRDVGRQGKGPGEYESPDGMATLPDGRILVRDPPNGRITVFAPTGDYLEDWPLSAGFNSNRRFYVDTAGNSYVTALMERGLAPWDWRFALIRYDTGGQIVDTVPAPSWDYETPSVRASREGSSSVRRIPFTPQVSWTFSPLGYMAGGLSTEYRIDLFPEKGPVIRIETEWEPVPVSGGEARERRRRITEGLQRQYGSWRWNGPPIPDTKPPFHDLFVSSTGDIWVALSGEGVPFMSESEAREEERQSGRVVLRFREHPSFDVFGADGRFLGHVRVPQSFRLEPEPIVKGDTVWAVTRDELEVPRIVRFRLTSR